MTARALLTRSAFLLGLEVPLLPQPKSVGNPDFTLPTTSQSQTDTLELLTCEHAPDDSTHTREEVRKGPGRGVGGISRHPYCHQAQYPPFPHSHLCFSVSFTIMGESSYSTKTPGSPWSPSSPLATFSCLVTEN